MRHVFMVCTTVAFTAIAATGCTHTTDQGARPDFATIDTKNHGYVLAAEVQDPWLKDNFSKCDTDGDGKVTRDEYGICVKK